MIGQIPRGKDSRNRCARCSGLYFDVSAVMGFQNAVDQFTRRSMANCNKDTLAGDICQLDGFDVFHARGFYAAGIFASKNFHNLVEPDSFNFGIFK